MYRDRLDARKNWMLPLVALLMLALPDAATADDGEAKARREFHNGLAAAKRGDYQGALFHYRKSYQHKPHARTMFNLASVAELLGRDEEAYEAYRNFLATATDQESELVPSAERKLAALELELRATLMVESVPSGARVYVDGNARPAGVTPIRLRLTPGKHALLLTAAGRKATPAQVDITPRVDDDVTVELAEERTTSTLRIRSNVRGASIEIDGETVGATSLINDDPITREVAAGNRLLTVRGGGRQPLTRALTLRPGEGMNVEIALEPGRTRRSWIIVGSLAAAGSVLTGLGAVQGVRAVRAEDDQDQDLARSADWFGGAGLSLIAGAVIGFFVTSPDPSTSEVWPLQQPAPPPPPEEH